MLKRTVGSLVLVMALLAVPVALSQMEQGQPTVYTYVAQFQVPRADWAKFNEGSEKTFVPLADKMVADGTILGYSTFEHVVHTPEGYTHGSAWSSTSIAGLMKVLDELRKGGPQPGQIASTKHEDFLMQTNLYMAAGGSPKPAYVRVVCQNAKPDKPGEYAAALKKYLWPTFEDQVKKGAASYVALDSQYINTLAPSMQCVVVNYPNAESLDKWAAAISATFGKMSAADREALFGATVADSRRDILLRITHSGHK